MQPDRLTASEEASGTGLGQGGAVQKAVETVLQQVAVARTVL